MRVLEIRHARIGDPIAFNHQGSQAGKMADVSHPDITDVLVANR